MLEQIEMLDPSVRMTHDEIFSFNDRKVRRDNNSVTVQQLACAEKET
jgi:hypothetical protein